MDWMTILLTVSSSLGGFSLIQWLFNRSAEKRQNLTKTHDDQFELFRKMNDYMNEKFDIFREKEEAASLRVEGHYESISNKLQLMSDEIGELKRHDLDIDRSIENFNKELIRLQILHFITAYRDSNTDSERDYQYKVLKNLYKEYKERYKGNSYICHLVGVVEKDYTSKRTAKRQSNNPKRRITKQEGV